FRPSAEAYLAAGAVAKRDGAVARAEPAPERRARAARPRETGERELDVLARPERVRSKVRARAEVDAGLRAADRDAVRPAAPEDPCDESLVRRLACEERPDTLPRRRRAPLPLRGLHRVRVGRPHVRARDLVAVALDEPVKREEPRLHRERGLALGVVARCAGER